MLTLEARVTGASFLLGTADLGSTKGFSTVPAGGGGGVDGCSAALAWALLMAEVGAAGGAGAVAGLVAGGMDGVWGFGAVAGSARWGSDGAGIV